MNCQLTKLLILLEMESRLRELRLCWEAVLKACWVHSFVCPPPHEKDEGGSSSASGLCISLSLSLSLSLSVSLSVSLPLSLSVSLSVSLPPLRP